MCDALIDRIGYNAEKEEGKQILEHAESLISHTQPSNSGPQRTNINSYLYSRAHPWMEKTKRKKSIVSEQIKLQRFQS